MLLDFSKPILLDGATGTELQKRGMPLNTCSELWNLEHPDAIKDIQRAYVEAGAQIVYAPTFGCNRPALERHHADIPVAESCARLVELSREAVDGKALVAGDMSPCGLQMEPFGSATFDDVVAVFREQAEALEAAGVDLFAVETQISLEEAKATVTAVRQVSDKPIFVSFSCGSTGRSIWGDDLAEAAAVMEAMGVAAYGVNCCGDLELLVTLVKDIRTRCSLPIIVKPNAGLPVEDNGRMVYKMQPSELAASVGALYNAGARIFGGCCGTNAAHIAAIRDALAAL